MNTKYQTTAEKSAEIRTNLKKLYGITSRQVSVTSRNGSIEVRIHDHKVDVREVRNLADKHESVRYCEVSGEILSGGNTFLNVAYSEKACTAYAAAHAEELAAVIAGAEPEAGGGGRPALVDGLPCVVLLSNNGNLIMSYGSDDNRKHGHYIWRSTMSAELLASEILGLRQKAY